MTTVSIAMLEACWLSSGFVTLASSVTGLSVRHLYTSTDHTLWWAGRRNLEKDEVLEEELTFSSLTVTHSIQQSPS